MDYPSPPPLDPPKKSTAKWWIIGCSGCFIIVAVIASFLAYGMYQGMKFLGGSAETGAAYLQIMTSPEVTEALGSPVEPTGFPPSTEDETTKTSTVTLSGPKGTGVGKLIQEKQPDGKWKITTATFTPSGGAEVEIKLQQFLP